MSRNAIAGHGAVAERLHAVAIHLLRRVRQTDPQMGLTAAQGSALSVLVFGGARTIGDLAAIEQVTAPTMTRLVAGLEAAGHVTRRAGKEDRRSVILRATAKGRRTLERGRRLRVAQLEAVLADVGASEMAAIETAVTALERALGRSGRSGPPLRR
ncbi:MAG: MarR family transcriptional regulator [Gemmatimonadetes bacterium]|nr:MarR family transcriptional regulator [Gemmatimonadota bacterium]